MKNIPLEQFNEFLGNGVAIEMVAIPSGTFWMGADLKESIWIDELPRHEVTVRPFYMGKYPITQAQWRSIASRTDLKVERDLDPNPSCFQDKLPGLLNYGNTDNHPVERISWHDAAEFCDRLSKLTGRYYRLPSEAEWEYACRAGTTTRFHFGETINIDMASIRSWKDEGNWLQTCPVGQFAPNAFGLYDMHGNVNEWCEDDWHENYEGAPTDGSAWLTKSKEVAKGKVIRGGSWYNSGALCRSAFRCSFGSDCIFSSVGFRVVCEEF